MYSYEIGGKTYIQKPLVLGQIRQLTDLLKEMKFPQNIDIPGIIAILGAKLGGALAIILTEAGVSLKDKDLNTLERELEFNISPDLAIQVIEDFFSCNPIASLFQRLTGAINRIPEMIKTASKNSASTSAKETLQNGMPSSGDIPSENASHTSSTVYATSQ